MRVDRLIVDVLFAEGTFVWCFLSFAVAGSSTFVFFMRLISLDSSQCHILIFPWILSPAWLWLQAVANFSIGEGRATNKYIGMFLQARSTKRDTETNTNSYWLGVSFGRTIYQNLFFAPSRLSLLEGAMGVLRWF